MKHKKKYISIKEALKRLQEAGVNITGPTLISWCQKTGLGKQLGGKRSKWLIDEVKLKERIG